jgi:hypothetical protein
MIRTELLVGVFVFAISTVPAVMHAEPVPDIV